MIHSEGENLVFLFSLPRSGSTLLSLLLDNTPSVLCPAEPWFLLKLAHLMKPWAVNILIDDQLAIMGTNDFLEGDTSLLATRAFAVAAYNHHLSQSGKNVFVDKTPRYFHILPLIDSLFPKAKKIWLQRNPLDVAHSYLHSWGIDVDMIVGNIFKTVSLDFAIGLFNLASYFSTPTSNKYIVKYEDLVQFPDIALRPLCDFMEVTFEEAMLDYGNNAHSLARHKKAKLGDRKAIKTRGIHTNSINKWEAGFSDEDLTKILQYLGKEIFIQMGYQKTLEELTYRNVLFCDENESQRKREKVSKHYNSEISHMETQLLDLHNAYRPKFINQKLAQRKSWWRTKLRSLYE